MYLKLSKPALKTQANQEPAQESVKNAKFFYANLWKLCERYNSNNLATIK